MSMRQLLPIFVTALVLIGCEDNSTLETAKDKVNDALDRRPAEGIRDAAEDMKAAAKDVGEEVRDAARDVAHEAREAAKEAKESAHDATH